jgi:Protein of unknown function (DUF2735)
MNSDVKTTTAKIYQFPLRAPNTATERPATPPPVRIVYGSCWYHDDAIRSEPTPMKPVC